MPAGQVVEGNSKLQAGQSVSQFAGPALGGVLLKSIGSAAVLAINSCGYLVSALFLFRIRHQEKVPPISTRRPLIAGIADGLRFVVRHRLFMLRRLRLSPLTIGVIDSAAAIVILSLANPLSSMLPPVPTLIIGGMAMMAAIVDYDIVTVSFRQRLCPPDLLAG